METVADPSREEHKPPMASFEESYRALYATFGYPLTPSLALPADLLKAQEKRLGIRVPEALRDYYLVAGRERRFNACHNRLLPPTAWYVDKKRLVFLEENQSVASWGVSIRNPDSDDPPVSQGMHEEPMLWSPSHRKCSAFLAVMLHFQAVSGGFGYCGRSAVPTEISYRFAEHGWTCHGKLDSMTAYSRPNQVVCLSPPGDLPFMRDWTVQAGGKTRRDLQTIAGELGISFS